MRIAVPKLEILSGESAVVAATPSEDEAADYAGPEDLIADYLDHLCAPLVGVVPYPERSRLREETGYHLERLANAYLLEGETPAKATRRAIQKYGSSAEVGQLFLETWFAHQPQGWLARRLGLANVRALTYFGAATLLATLLIQLRVYHPDPEPLTFGLSLAQVRRLVPEPLPLPDGAPISILLAVLAVAAPFVAGALTGASVPVRPARAVYLVQTALTLYTFVLGVQMLPTREGLLLALFQLFFWLPVGCAMAHVVAVLTWRRRCRFRFRETT